MSRNRRRSLPDIVTPSEEEQPAPVEQNANSETRLQSRSLSSLELLDQASSIYLTGTGTTADQVQPPQRVDLALGTESEWSSSLQPGETSADLSFYDIRHPAASYRPFSHILVEASKETKGPESDHDVPEPKEEDPPPVRYENITEPISELPFVEPTFSRYTRHILPEVPASRVSSEISFLTLTWKESMSPSLGLSSISHNFQSGIEGERRHDEISISGKDEYDREEPLITKTQKYYKKRAPLVPLYDDSDDSDAVPHKGQKDRLPIIDTRDQRIEDAESPGYLSEYSAKKRAPNRQKTPSSSEEGPRKEEGFGDRTMQHLRSGMVFIYMVIPPDGGYGWLIMVLSFFCQLIVDGIIFSIGTILPAIEQEFGASKSTMVLVASVQIGCYFTSGAFASILINRFAFRPVAISGAIASILAIVAGSYSPNLVGLILCYSALGGSTLSLMWCSSQLIVTCYFERYRPMANGFACSGAGAGSFVFSLLNSWLVPTIGWRNMLRVQAVLILVAMLLTIAYVEVAPTQVGVLPENILDSSSDEYYGNFYVHDFLRVTPDKSVKSGSLLSIYNPDKDKRKFCSCWRRCARKRQERKEQRRRERENNLLIRTEYIEREDLFYTGPADYEEPHSMENLEGKEIHLMGPDKNTQHVNYGIQHINKREGDDNKDTPVTTKKGKAPQKRRRGKKCMAILSRLFDYHLFKQFEFRILVASAFLYPMGFNIPFVYSKARTVIPLKYAQMISPAIGLSNFTFRIVCGFVAYKRRHWTTTICGGGLVFGGFFVFVSAFFGQDLVWFQLVYGFCYGMAPAVYSTLRALIYVKYLGLPKLTNAFGITALAMGIGVFTGTTIAGRIVGDNLNYSAAFIFAGVCLVVSGILKLLLPPMVRCRHRRKSQSLQRELERKRERKRNEEKERERERNRAH